VKNGILLSLCLASAPVLADNWLVYEDGQALQLAIDPASIWRENGRIHFVNQERFTLRQQDAKLGISYHIRRLSGWADCSRYRYAFVGANFYTASGKNVYTQMFPLPQYDWAWQAVDQGSVAAAMMREVCRLGRNAPTKKTQ
jgi:hypothetical protein